MFPKKFFVWIFSLAMALILFFGITPIIIIGIFRSYFANIEAAPVKKNLVSVVKLEGEILDARKVVQELHKQVYKPGVHGVVLRINSPGGAVGPSQEINMAVQKLKAVKPIVVSMGAVAASGGLYSALSASKVLCQPGTMTGSIGVILQLPNLKKISDLVGFQMLTVKSGALKDVGNPFRDATEEDKAFLTTTIDVAYQDFVKAVSEGRNIPMDKVKLFADGRVILGSQAVELGLADGFGDIYDAARAVFEIKGTPLNADEMPDLYYPQDRFKYLEGFDDAFESAMQWLRPRMEMKYIL